MVKISRFFAYVSFFILSLMYFAPKISMYYFLEKQLQNYELIISNEECIDTGYALDIKHATVSLKSIDAAKIAEINIKIFAFYNSINVNDIYLSSMASSFVPLKIENVNIVYSVIDPTNILATSYGEFGEIDAKFDLLEMKFRAILTPSKLMLSKYKNTLRKFKKLKTGGYLYEKNI